MYIFELFLRLVISEPLQLISYSFNCLFKLLSQFIVCALYEHYVAGSNPVTPIVIAWVLESPNFESQNIPGIFRGLCRFSNKKATEGLT